MSATKQRSSAAKGVLVFFIVFMILEGLVIFGLCRVFKNKDVTPSIAGYSMYIMDSNAMGDDVPKGALVVAANGAPSIESISKAVLCEEVPGIGTSVFWLANVSTSADLQGVVYTVFQNNDPTKLYELKTKNIVGTATSYYVTAGKIITFMTSKFGIIALIAAPLFLLVLLEVIIMIVNHSRYDDDDDDDDDDYDEDEDEDDDDEKPVKLDDFLFGGENEKALIENSVHQGEEAAAEITERKRPEGTRQSKRPADAVRSERPERQTRAARPEKQPADSNDIADEIFKEAPKPKKAAEPEKTAEPAAESKPEIDPAYYEKAAKLIDGENAAPAEAAPETPKAEAPKPAENDIKFSQPAPKDVTAGFEDLMKLMEAESEKLRNSLNDK